MPGLIRALRALIEDPSSNFAATGTAIAIVVVGMIILVLLLIAAAIPGATAAAANLPESRRQRRLSRLSAWSLGLTIVALGGLISAAAWYQVTSPNEYCARTCHAMRNASLTWQQSAHTSVTCTRCHEGTPWRSFPAGVAARTRSIYYQVTGARPQRRSVPARICLSCHVGLLDMRLTARNGEGFYHRQLITGRSGCSECHGAQGHVPPK